MNKTKTIEDIHLYEASTSKPWLSSPHRLEYAERTWVAATEGHILVLIPDDDKYPLIAEEGGNSYRSVLLPSESLELQTSRTPLAVLRKWADVPAWPVQCNPCKGTGDQIRTCDHCEADHVCICEECGGDGTVDPEAKYGTVDGVVLNRILTKRALDAVPDVYGDAAEEIKIFVISDRKTGKRVQFVGRDWIVLQMSMVKAAEGAEVVALAIEKVAEAEAIAP